MELEFPSGHFPWGLKFLPQFQATELIFPGHFLVLWKGVALLPISGFPESLAFTNSVAWPLSPLSLRHITAVTLLSVSLTVKQAGRHLQIDLRRELGEKVAAGPCPHPEAGHTAGALNCQPLFPFTCSCKIEVCTTFGITDCRECQCTGLDFRGCILSWPLPSTEVRRKVPVERFPHIIEESGESGYNSVPPSLWVVEELRRMSKFSVSDTDLGQVMESLNHSPAFDDILMGPEAQRSWNPTSLAAESSRARTCNVHSIPKPEMSCPQTSLPPAPRGSRPQ